MHVISGRFRPGGEVDRMHWLSLSDAVKRLTYTRDKTLLAQQNLR